MNKHIKSCNNNTNVLLSCMWLYLRKLSEFYLPQSFRHHVMQKMSKCENLSRVGSFKNHYSKNIHYIHCFCKISQYKYFVFSSSLCSELGILLIIKWQVAFEIQKMYKNLRHEFSTIFLNVENHQMLHHKTTNFGGLQICVYFYNFPLI